MDLEQRLAQRIFEKEGCQWIGPEQTEYPYTMCGHPVIEGKPYCSEHYPRVYMNSGKARSASKKPRTVAKIQQIFD